MDKNIKKHNNLIKRKNRVRKKVIGSSIRPRVSVFRSNKHISVQCIDDSKSHTIASYSTILLDSKNNNVESAFKVGELLAKKLIKLKLSTIVFDKNGRKFHGKIKSVADGLKKGGIKF